MAQLTYQSYNTYFQSALTALLSTLAPAVPVYNNYNINSANDPEFVVWAIRNMQQEVWTGSQANKGIDYPVFGLTVFAKTNPRLITIVDRIITSWHGYTGNLNGISVGKLDVDLLLTTYDDESSTYQAVIDINATVAVPTTVTAATPQRNSSTATNSQRR